MVEEGDRIRIDADARSLELLVDDETLDARRDGWTAPAPRYTTGALAKYAKEWRPASENRWLLLRTEDKSLAELVKGMHVALVRARRRTDAHACACGDIGR